MYSGYFLFVATFYSLLGMLTLQTRYPPFVVFAAGNCVNVLGLVAGSLIGSTIEAFATPWWVYAISVALMYVLFFVGLIVLPRSRQNIFNAADLTRSNRGSGQPSLASAVESYCHISAQKCSLTQREEEVMNYLVRGRSIMAIANLTTLSQNTIKTHVQHIYQKLDIHSREELIVAVEQLGELLDDE